MKIWLDTDLGSDVDDALALAYGLRHPHLEVVGISTVFGDVELRSQCAEALLQKANVKEIPVLTGLGKPLTERRAGIMFGHEGRGLLKSPKPNLRIELESPKTTEARIEALAGALEATDPDYIVAIGPLTNLGALVRLGALLPPLAIMGGKSQRAIIPGMNDRIAEWNFFSDPVATRTVIDAQAKSLHRIVPAEVTFQTSLDSSDLELLSEGDELCQTLHTLCRVWLDYLSQHFKTSNPKVALHDPLTLATLPEPGLCSFEPQSVEVDDKGNMIPAETEPNAEVALDVNLGDLRSSLLEVWQNHSKKQARSD